MLLCFYLADPFLAIYRDPMEEPTTELIIDEHQDATYEVPRWKCKSFESIEQLVSFIPFKSNHLFVYIEWIVRQKEDR